MSVELLTEHHLEFLSLTGGCTGLSESILVKMPHCWKSHTLAQIHGKSMLMCMSICMLFYSIIMLLRTVVPAKSDSDVIFCLQKYQGLRIDRSLVY